MRDRGVLAESGYWPWSNINSYSWLPSSSDTALLVLKIKKPSRFLSLLRDLLPLGGIPVPIGDKRQFEAILDRQLGEWPRSHSALEGVQESVNTEVSPQNRTVVKWFVIYGGFVLVTMINPALIYHSARRQQPALSPANPPQAATNLQAEQFGQIALNAISQFHNDFSDERYDDACRSVDRQAMRGITDLPCKQYLASVHTKLGKVENSEQIIRAVGPVGTEMNVVIDCRTRFEHGIATEHFEWRLGGGASNSEVVPY